MVRQDRLVSCHNWISDFQCKLFTLCEKNRLRDCVGIICVDDLMVTRENDTDIDEVKLLLKQKFGMKDFGELHYFLGIEVITSPSGIWLS